MDRTRWPKNCSKCMDPSLPTKEDWQKMLPLIGEIYSDQGDSLQSVGGTMCLNYDFHAKERQYKSRLKLIIPHSKRLRSEQYLAMATMLQLHHPLIDHFEAWRGGRRVKVLPQQISKELGRSQKRVDPHSASSRFTLSLKDAQRILDLNGIKYFLHSQIESRSSPRHPSSVLSPNSPSIDTLGFYKSSVMGTLPTANEMPVATSFLSPTSETTSQSPTLSSSPHEPGEGAHSINRQQLSLAGMNVSSMHSTPTQSQFDHYDPSWMFTDIESGIPSSADIHVTSITSLPRPQAPPNTSSRMLGDWVRPHLDAGFYSHMLDSVELAERKQRGVERLNFVLTNDPTNKFILPYLNSMIVVLGSNCKREQLLEFLSESCEAIEKLGHLTAYLALSFRYAWADWKEDVEEMRALGTRFEETHHQLENYCGKDHPNVIINSYYWAWHLLGEHRYHAVITMLEEMLPRARKSMGTYNLVIVNCLAILARAYTEASDHQHHIAHKLLEEALRLLEDRPYTLAYRLTLTLRLAETQTSLGDTNSAERTLTSVILQYGRLFGYGSRRTWAAIEAMQNLLIQSGREDAANEVKLFYTKKWNREQEVRWRIDNGYEIPPELAGSPLPSVALPSSCEDIRQHHL